MSFTTRCTSTATSSGDSAIFLRGRLYRAGRAERFRVSGPRGAAGNARAAGRGGAGAVSCPPQPRLRAAMRPPSERLPRSGVGRVLKNGPGCLLQWRGFPGGGGSRSEERRAGEPSALNRPHSTAWSAGAEPPFGVCLPRFVDVVP